MKAKEANNLLKNLSGNDLFQKASELYREEVGRVITERSHGNKPTSNLIDSAINEVNNWFIKATKDLNWSDLELPKKIIGWERGDIWVKYNMMDSRLVAWGKRTRHAMAKGEILPILAAMKPGDLDAASSTMLANIRKGLNGWQKQRDKVKEFCEKVIQKRQCPYGVDEKTCPYSETYSMVKLPTNTNDLVFVCTIDKCIKEDK